MNHLDLLVVVAIGVLLILALLAFLMGSFVQLTNQALSLSNCMTPAFGYDSGSFANLWWL